MFYTPSGLGYRVEGLEFAIHIFLGTTLNPKPATQNLKPKLAKRRIDAMCFRFGMLLLGPSLRTQRMRNSSFPWEQQWKVPLRVCKVCKIPPPLVGSGFRG